MLLAMRISRELMNSLIECIQSVLATYVENKVKKPAKRKNVNKVLLEEKVNSNTVLTAVC